MDTGDGSIGVAAEPAGMVRRKRDSVMVERRQTRGGVGSMVAIAALALAGVATPPVASPDAARAAGGPTSATTQAAPPVARPEPVVPRSGRPARLGGGGRAAWVPTDAERAEAMQFMKTYAPESYKAIMATSDREPQRAALERGITRAYLNYQQVRANNADGLYEVILRRVRSEDQIYGLTVQVRHAAPQDREGLTAALRAAVTDWSDVSLQERRLRLTRLERSAQKEARQLAEDNAHKDRLIQKRLDRVLNDAGGDSDAWSTGGDPPRGEASH